MTSGSPAVAEAMSYDGFGAPTLFSGTLNGTPVGGVTLAYDAAGRISQKNDAWAFPMVVPQPAMSTAEWTYTYDEAGRLATATRTGEATRTYTYDARGNRSAISPSEDPAKAPDEQDRMPQVGQPGDADYTTYTYDAHGNVTGRTANGVTHTFTWDGEGSLLGVKQGGADIVTYDVDAKGRRVGRRVGTNLTHQWFYDGQLRIVGEVVYGATPSYRVYGYVGERHLPVTMVETKGAITSSYRIFGDHLGSLRAVVRTSGTVGQVVQSMRHGPWGELDAEWLDAGFARVPFGFAGGVFETVTGLVRFGAREYDPRTGRWLTKDEARFGGGENFYEYANPNPVNWIDLNGRGPIQFVKCLASGKSFAECWDDEYDRLAGFGSEPPDDPTDTHDPSAAETCSQHPRGSGLRFDCCAHHCDFVEDMCPSTAVAECMTECTAAPHVPIPAGVVRPGKPAGPFR